MRFVVLSACLAAVFVFGFASEPFAHGHHGGGGRNHGGEHYYGCGHW